MEVQEAPECPVCFDQYVDPVLLSCGHVICWPCLQETRRSAAGTAKVCPHSLCQYVRATPMFLSGSLVMSLPQKELYGERRAVEFEVSPHASPLSSPHVTPPPSPHVTPPPSPRRSARRRARNRRFDDFVTNSIGGQADERGGQPGQADESVGESGQADGRGGEPGQSGRRGRGSRGIVRIEERSFMDDSSDEEMSGGGGEPGQNGRGSGQVDGSRRAREPGQVEGRRRARERGQVEGRAAGRGRGRGQAEGRGRRRGSMGIVRIEESSDEEIRDLFDNPGDIEERNDDNGHGTENTQPVGHSRTSTYFKTYAIIEGTQKTHDSAILEAVLERMTMKQRRRSQIKLMQIARDIKDVYESSFPGLGGTGLRAIKAISKHVGRSLERSVTDYKTKTREVGGSGQTGPANSPDENLVSQILSLDDSLRLNGPNQAAAIAQNPVPANEAGSSTSQNLNGRAENGQIAARVLAPHDRPLIVADMNLQNPVVINRRRISQENGIEARESSMSTLRRPRQGHPRLESSLSNIVETASSDARSVSREVNSTLSVAVDDRQHYRERKMEEDRRQRELDREANKEEKQKDREDRMQANLLVASVMSRILPGTSELVRTPKLRNVQVQFLPEEGSQPYPLMVTLASLPTLLSELREYTQVPEASGIVWERGDSRTVLISNIDQIEFSADVVKVVTVQKSGKTYFKLSH